VPRWIVYCAIPAVVVANRLVFAAAGWTLLRARANRPMALKA
jgi:hypothetical protein